MTSMADRDLEADLKATLAARRELGAEYEAVLARSFVEKLDHEVDARVEEALSARAARLRTPPVARRRARGGTGLAVSSIALGIPVSAVVASNLHGSDSLVGVVVAWAAIAVINVVNARERRAP